ncbi:unnamed protein product [Oncorhynchus mykiss]|uniref:Uncharacterized protein n=1 Tax=Oncorhynchus mykiss TaxID=8022 RepID=A0A060YMX2_ONCMY|nr:unnamed protein product [Oncorhynchus mykiss]
MLYVDISTTPQTDTAGQITHSCWYYVLASKIVLIIYFLEYNSLSYRAKATMHCQYILQLSLLTLLSLPGTLAQTWSVWYRDRDRITVICASKGSSVVFDCIYSYPATQIVRRKIWFTPRGDTKQDGSQQGDGVFNTSGLTNK